MGCSTGGGGVGCMCNIDVLSVYVLESLRIFEGKVLSGLCMPVLSGGGNMEYRALCSPRLVVLSVDSLGVYANIRCAVNGLLEENKLWLSVA